MVRHTISSDGVPDKELHKKGDRRRRSSAVVHVNGEGVETMGQRSDTQKSLALRAYSALVKGVYSQPSLPTEKRLELLGLARSSLGITDQFHVAELRRLSADASLASVCAKPNPEDETSSVSMEPPNGRTSGKAIRKKQRAAERAERAQRRNVDGSPGPPSVTSAADSVPREGPPTKFRKSEVEIVITNMPDGQRGIPVHEEPDPPVIVEAVVKGSGEAITCKEDLLRLVPEGQRAAAEAKDEYQLLVTLHDVKRRYTPDTVSDVCKWTTDYSTDGGKLVLRGLKFTDAARQYCHRYTFRAALHVGGKPLVNKWTASFPVTDDGTADSASVSEASTVSSTPVRKRPHEPSADILSPQPKRISSEPLKQSSSEPPKKLGSDGVTLFGLGNVEDDLDVLLSRIQIQDTVFAVRENGQYGFTATSEFFRLTKDTASSFDSDTAKELERYAVLRRRLSNAANVAGDNCLEKHKILKVLKNVVLRMLELTAHSALFEDKADAMDTSHA